MPRTDEIEKAERSVQGILGMIMRVLPRKRTLSLLAFPAIICKLIAGHAGHSHGGGSHDDDVSADTIKLHRIANDPVSEDVELLRAILAKGDADLDVNYQHPRSGQTPLMASCLGGKAKIAKVLLEEGNADPMVPEKDGYHSVHGAGFQGRADVMKVLLDHGVDVRHAHADGFDHCTAPARARSAADTVALLIGGNPHGAAAPSASRTYLEMTSTPTPSSAAANEWRRRWTAKAKAKTTKKKMEDEEDRQREGGRGRVLNTAKSGKTEGRVI